MVLFEVIRKNCKDLSPHFDSLICSASINRSKVNSLPGPLFTNDGADELFKSSLCYKFHKLFQLAIQIATVNEKMSIYLLRFSASLPFFLYCFAFHATIEAFLVTTILTSISLLLINHTISILPTRIRQIFSYCALKETLTSLTAENI
jgi:hypothetical protein